LRIIAQLPKDSLFISIEFNSEFVKTAHSVLEYADVDDRVKIITDYTENVIPRLSKDFNINSFDLIFIDHEKSIYLRDFKMLEEAGLIKSGTMIVCDNVITPGAPDYLEYVRNNPNYTTTFYEANIEYGEDLPDGIEISIRK
jgi:catechol O-methyltransferase